MGSPCLATKIIDKLMDEAFGVAVIQLKSTFARGHIIAIPSLIAAGGQPHAFAFGRRDVEVAK